MGNSDKTTRIFAIGAILIILALIGGFIYMFGGAKTQTALPGSTTGGAAGATDLAPCGIGNEPTPTYSATDKATNGDVGGTTRVKAPGQGIQATPSVSGGVSLLVYKQNASYFCDYTATQAKCGQFPAVTTCIKNATSITTSVADARNNNAAITVSTTGTANFTLGADSFIKAKVSMSAGKYGAIAPFGAVIAVEAPVNVSSVEVLSGSPISSGLGGNSLTLSATQTGGNVFYFNTPPMDSVTGDEYVYNFQVNTASDNTNGVVYVKVYPINVYEGLDGTFHKDVTKALSSTQSALTFNGGSQGSTPSVIIPFGVN